MEKVISKEAAEQIVEILIKYKMMSSHRIERESFIYSATQGTITEWRLIGYCGKFWNEHGKWSVEGYSERRTAKRDEEEVKVNKELADLFKSFH